MSENEIATIIVDSCYKVHKVLGPGLLESAYQACLIHELKKHPLNVQREVALPIIYENEKLELGYRIDIWVNNKVIVEIKAVESLNDVHLAQILTYLRLSENKLGILVNFNVALIKHGVKRVANAL